MKKIILGFMLLCSLKGITQCVSPTFSIQTTPETCLGCCDGTAYLTNLNLGGSACGTIFLWQPSLQQSSSAINLCAGSVTVTVYSDCCTNPGIGFCGIGTTITTNILNLNNLEIFLEGFSNPSNGKFKIHSKNKKSLNTIFTIIDSNGKIVFEKKMTDSENEIDCRLDNGLYFYRLTDESISGKLIINK